MKEEMTVGNETRRAVQMTGVSKSFARVVANDRVDFEAREGEIHALVGENGAGKTTLMNILSGLYRPDEGEIRLFGKSVHLSSPADAIRHGVGMVHQHFMLVPPFTVAENVLLGAEPRRFGALLDTRAAELRIAEISDLYNLRISPRKKVADLSIGEQQKVEIIKILFRNATVLILDEPSAVLTPQEVEHFFSILNRLKEQCHTIILITHKLREVKAISDRLTVLRGGRRIGTLDTPTAEEATIAEMMIGRTVLLETPESRVEDSARRRSRLRGGAAKGAPVLEIKSLVVKDTSPPARAEGYTKLSNLTLTVSSGEILGIAGVEGNGQAEIVGSIIGLLPTASGSVLLNGSDITRRSIQERRRLGIAYIPEDRQRLGLVLDLSAGENLVLGQQASREFSRFFRLWRARPAIRRFAFSQMQHYDIRPPDPDRSARTFSGGNQQKLVLARELSRDVKLLIAMHPTRGLDLAATQFVRSVLVEKRSQGAAIMLISADLSELLALSDRIAVLYEGTIVAILDAHATNEHEIGMLMTGSNLRNPDSVGKNL